MTNQIKLARGESLNWLTDGKLTPWEFGTRLYCGSCYDWHTRPGGIAVRREIDDTDEIRFVRNGDPGAWEGSSLLYRYRGRCHYGWGARPDGIVLRREIVDDIHEIRFALDGSESMWGDSMPLLYRGQITNWTARLDDVAVCRDAGISEIRLVRAGGPVMWDELPLLYRGQQKGWQARPDGVAVRCQIDNNISEVRLARNGGPVMWDELPLLYRGQFYDWRALPDGIAVFRHLVDDIHEIRFARDSRLGTWDELPLLYRGQLYDWAALPDGIALRRHIGGTHEIRSFSGPPRYIAPPPGAEIIW